MAGSQGGRINQQPPRRANAACVLAAGCAVASDLEQNGVSAQQHGPGQVPEVLLDSGGQHKRSTTAICNLQANEQGRSRRAWQGAEPVQA